MFRSAKFCLLPLMLLVAGCSCFSSKTTASQTTSEEPSFLSSLFSFHEEEPVPPYLAPVVLPERAPSGVTAAGLRYCPNNRQCTGDPILPPQPCEQPMPQYYKNISELASADGVLLIHPYTRTKILCLDDEAGSAVDCANFFHTEGYVLITDIPQFAGKYDFLRTGSYPGRRWRDGENVPRW